MADVALQGERERFVEFLRARGLRMTRERIAVLDEIYALHGHIDAEAVWRSLREREAKVSRATVYRNLELLVAAGLVRKHRLGGKRHLFEHMHRGQRHDHLVCRHCGRVVEFLSPAIEALQREICRAHHFSPSEHSLQIQGVCLSCAGQPGAASGGAR
jgi:Fur family ferric uptake transcriptional regulator